MLYLRLLWSVEMFENLVIKYSKNTCEKHKIQKKANVETWMEDLFQLFGHER